MIVGIRVSNIEALADVIHQGWTQAKYKSHRKKSKKRNAPVYPSWEEVMKAKEECTPPNIDFQERVVTVSMQDTMLHYMKKLMKDDGLVNRLKKMKGKNPNLVYEMVYKWGADGASQFSHYKNCKDDTSMFASNMVPTFIEAIDPTTEQSFNVWSNPFANSAYGVIPLRWAFEKETTGMFSLVLLLSNLRSKSVGHTGAQTKFLSINSLEFDV